MRNSSKKAIIVLVGAFAAMLVPPAMADDHVELHAHDYMTAPLLEGMGSWSRPISTRVPLVQRYFDQGLTLAYAFNHAEAERSFLEAARLDPSCAMCFWGAALVLGPNINAPMKDADVPRAFAVPRKGLAPRRRWRPSGFALPAPARWEGPQPCP